MKSHRKSRLYLPKFGDKLWRLNHLELSYTSAFQWHSGYVFSYSAVFKSYMSHLPCGWHLVMVGGLRVSRLELLCSWKTHSSWTGWKIETRQRATASSLFYSCLFLVVAVLFLSFPLSGFSYLPWFFWLN